MSLSSTREIDQDRSMRGVGHEIPGGGMCKEVRSTFYA